MSTIVSAFALVLVILSAALEVCLVWRLLRAGLVSRYPYYSFYVFCVVLRTATLHAIQWYGIDRIPPDVYASYYWNTESIGIALRCLVVWEVFRHAFPPGSPLNKIAAKGFGVIAVGLFIFAIGTLGALWSYQAYVKLHSLYPALDRSFGFVQSAFILAILLAVKSYGIRLGRNLWGIAVGFGAWISLSTLNNAAIDLTHSFYPVLQFLRPLSFVGLLSAWTWALWEVSPLPADDHRSIPIVELDTWTENWNRTQSSWRRVKPS
jgi:hypothetical protein